MEGQSYILNNLRWASFSKTKIGLKMNGFVGVTDNDWFAFLSQQPEIDEVNFWQSSRKSRFRKLVIKRDALKILNCQKLLRKT